MRMRGKKNLIIKLVVSLVISYVLFRAKWQSASFGTSVSENPHQVWEFVSDLNNAKLLNPSIYDFYITEHDKGNYEHWEYGAVIYETMSFIPILTNVNYADFTLKTSPNKDLYRIQSTYKTCFFRYACLNSKSEMTFSSNVAYGGTKFHETIDYQCPFILSWLCSRELTHQRNEWMHRLEKIYQN
ncbi:hypothetical protein DAPPUDRAFT_303988 [Daphnia pulex]|uniref:Uncharacterized protein n=1 Tax=Daphnia pulex TaxID=6669 RepID=E9GIU6_DAPPU|nr:hypothetical protein DAPPUDRAFT_303988 [Daphnia pulex]|eukprot:EFX80595.1 hypothetical protein DAPPUDRAFT_303988 [Daphnia pulex]